MSFWAGLTKILMNMTDTRLHQKSRFRIITAFMLASLSFLSSGWSQVSSPYGIEVTPISVEGAPIRSVVILLEKDGIEYLADSLELDAFHKAFAIKPGALFRQSFADLALRTIQQQPEIRSASYHVYNYEFGGPVTLVVKAAFLAKGEIKEIDGKKGMLVGGGLNSFPLLLETDHSKVTFILNGAAGVYNEINGLFAEGEAFTQGNPIATNPAGEGVRFWGESFIEPGIGGITRLGKSSFYPYGAVSYLISGRNTSDLYSDGPTIYGAVERLYAGMLIPKLGKQKNVHIDLSAGRQFFQLNDGFLFSRISGSANAGERGSVYLSSRTAFEMTALAKVQMNRFTLDGFYLEPQELFKSNQSDTRYVGGTLNYNTNKHLDVGVSYISIAHSNAQYSTPDGKLPIEGLQVINPKIWITDIFNTGLFLKSELALQSHATADMRSEAWYIGAGLQKKKWRFSPSLYYRYGFMKGDDPGTATYERFDALQTGGLGNWVQGLNFRKISGDGNLVSHRVELKGYVNSRFELTFDYFLLKADSPSNLGGLPPIINLNEKALGQEVTMDVRYYFGQHFMFLGILSWAQPGDGLEAAFEGGVPNWTSVQATMFMFF